MKLSFDALFASAGSFSHYLGYRYLYQSVLLVLEDPQKLCHICTMIYLPVAQQNQTCVSNVHKDLRTLLQSFWAQGGDQFFAAWTGCSRWLYDKPYPKEFIAVLAQVLKDKDLYH